MIAHLTRPLRSLYTILWQGMFNKEMSSRVVHIANRLPLSVETKGTRLSVRQSPGGVASGLYSHLSSLKGEYLWIGWPGRAFPQEMQQHVTKHIHEHLSAEPVFLPQELIDRYYHGFSNNVLWPLFHYFPSLVHLTERDWDGYKEANELFAKKILTEVSANDLIFIHDYQLLLLPKLLREKRPDLSVSFFLHTPFPSFEIFRMLPTQIREELLSGMLGADSIVFHTREYEHNFLMSVLRILGIEAKMGKMTVSRRLVKTGVFPLGVNVRTFEKQAKSAENKKRVSELRESFGEKKIIFSVDRLDYTKGITNRLEGYAAFLKEHPEWHEKVVLVLSSEPSRVSVENYRRLKQQLEEKVGNINGKYATLRWTPILYQYTSRSFAEMVSLYSLSDVALITPLRDGMNLIAKEFIASKTDGHGVLVLSELAGAAAELPDALLINPFDTSAIAKGIHSALMMGKREQVSRMKRMRHQLESSDIHVWANSLTEALLSVKAEQSERQLQVLGISEQEKLQRAYQKAERRLIFLDYDGTLVPFSTRPEMAGPDDALLRLLQTLSEDNRNELVLISGREKKTLSQWLPLKKLALVAEHGAFRRNRQSTSWSAAQQGSRRWKKGVYSFLQAWTSRTPGTFIEEKEYSLVWHYRAAVHTLRPEQIKTILYELLTYTANIEVEVVHGNMVIEVKSLGTTKGTAAEYWLQKKSYDFILAVGDDTTDEDLFAVLPPHASTIKVGETHSLAKFRLHSYREVRGLLRSLSEQEVLRDIPFIASYSRNN